MTMKPMQAKRDVTTAKIRNKPTGTADIMVKTSSNKARKGWSSRYWPKEEFMKAATYKSNTAR